MNVNEVIVIPEDFTPLNFRMDPATEDLIRGDKLENGMVVLIEQAMHREDPDRAFNTERELTAYEMERLQRNSRWCRVTGLYTQGDITQFIGVYADGTKHSRTYNLSYCWYVKL